MLRELMDVLTGKQIQLHTTNDTKERAGKQGGGTGAFGMMAACCSSWAWEVGGELVGCLFCGVTYSPG
ncbi:MAG: hypothetical protein IJN47_01570, partial [Clostridia bacterium]|nr:hypothetical protein [Clostridia bacterium]